MLLKKLTKDWWMLSEHTVELNLLKSLHTAEHLASERGWRSVKELFEEGPLGWWDIVEDTSLDLVSRKRAFKFLLLARYFKRARFGAESSLLLACDFAQRFHLTPIEQMTVCLVQADLYMEASNADEWSRCIGEAYWAVADLYRDLEHMCGQAREKLLTQHRLSQRSEFKGMIPPVNSAFFEDYLAQDVALKMFLELPKTWRRDPYMGWRF